MRWQYIFAILGMILCMFSISMLPPIIVNFIYAEQMFLPFVYTFFISYLCGYLLWSNFDSKHYELRNVEGIIVVATHVTCDIVSQHIKVIWPVVTIFITAILDLYL